MKTVIKSVPATSILQNSTTRLFPLPLLILTIAFLLASVGVTSSEAAPQLGVQMDSAVPHRFPEPYGYGIHVGYSLKWFDPEYDVIEGYEVQVDEGNGVWRTTQYMRPAGYDWANIHGTIACYDDLYNLPSGRTVKVRVRARYHIQPPIDDLPFKPSSGAAVQGLSGKTQSAWTRWSTPIEARVDPWVCAVCGDAVCEGDETSDTCPLDCAGGSVSSFSCVKDVAGSVSGITTRSSNASPVRTGNAQNWVSGTNPDMRVFASQLPYLNARNHVICHVQGLTRLRNTDRFVFSVNAWASGGLLNSCPHEPGKWGIDDLSYWGSYLVGAVGEQIWSDRVISETQQHPGGIQSAGEYVVVGADGGGSGGTVYIYHTPDKFTWDLVHSFPVLTKAQTTGIVMTAEKDYIISVGSGSSTWVDFYKSTSGIDGPYVKIANWQEGYVTCPNLPPIFCDTFNYNSINLVRECGTGDIYAVGTGRAGDLGDGGEETGDDYAHFLRVDDLDTGQVNFTLLGSKHFYMDQGNWAAGGGVYITDDGKMHLYGMKHGFSQSRHPDPNFPNFGDAYIRFTGYIDELW